MNSNSAIHISKYLTLNKSQFLAVGVLTRAEFALAEWEELNEDAFDFQARLKTAVIRVYLGDDHAPLCSENCADCWADNNTQSEYASDADMPWGPHQIAGFVEAVDRAEVVGHVCAHCGMQIA